MPAVVDRARATLHVALEVLRNPRLRRVELAFLAFTAVEFGSWVAILLYAYGATGPASVGAVALIQLLPAAVIAPFGGTLGDRFRRERVLLAAYGVFALLTATIAIGMLAAWPAATVYAAAILASMTLTLIRPAHNSLLPALTRSPSELTAGNAATSIAESSGLLLGPLAAAAILAVADPGTVLALLAIVAAIAAALMLRLRPMPRAGVGAPVDAGHAEVPSVPDSPGGSAVLAGFRALAAHGDARLIVGVLSARMLMIGVTDVLFVLLAIELFETGESGAAVLTASIGAGGIVGGAAGFLLAGRSRMAPVLVGCGLAWGVLFALIGVAGSGIAAPPLLVVGGAALALIDIGGRTILQRAVPDAVLARVFGILEGLTTVALAVGAIGVPLAVAVVGLEGSVLVFAAVLPMLVLVAWPGLRAIDRRADVPFRAIALLRRLRLFEALDPPALEFLARTVTWLTVGAGTVVIREGDQGDRFYVLESGAVEVTRGGTPVRTLSASGDSFGEIALLQDIPRTATVTAVGSSVLLALGRSEFLAAVTGHPVVTAEARRIVDAQLLDDRAVGTG